LYDKIRGKAHPKQLIWVNLALCREMIWLADHIERLPGINLLLTLEWSLRDADVVMYSDACPAGLAFWLPTTSEGFQHSVQAPGDQIFFLEALAVVSALHWYLHSTHPIVRRIVIFTDNENTVSMFNSLHASPILNPILLTAIDLLLQFDVQLRVFHVPGTDNGVADALSRFDNERALLLHHKLTIKPFIPPHLTLGATTL
jgi:hypothetical protein